MRILVLACVLFISVSAHCQSYLWNTDSARGTEPNYLMDKYHDLLRFHDPIMYLAYPYVKSAADRPLPLQEGEGKDGYFLEGNLAYRFVIFQGKYYSPPALQRLRSTFDVGMTLRLTTDYSSPLLPMNARFGLGLDYLLTSIEGLRKERSKVAWATVQLHHYSNGQSDSFFVEGPVRRNNYKGGDFSTNYARGLVNVAFNSEKSSTTLSAGYQHEVDLGGPLVLSPQLAGYYGLQRALFGLQWMIKPIDANVKMRNRGTTSDTDVVTLPVRRQFMLRTELEYILDDLSLWRGANPQRWNAHVYATYMPSVTNEVGFMAHAFYGRDYLNIRFDDVVFIGELGVYVKFNKQ